MTNNLPSKPKRTRRYHSPEFKAHVVSLCQESDASRAEVARRFDLNSCRFSLKKCVYAAFLSGFNSTVINTHNPPISAAAFNQ
jgi:hypothetical protein